MSQIEIKASERSAGKVDIFFGDILYKTIDGSLLAKMDLRRHLNITKEAFEELYFEKERQAARTLALALLARRSFFICELKERLMEKGIGANSCDAAIVFCESIGALSDHTKLCALIDKESRKGKSERAIRFSLRKYDLDQDLIEECFQKLCVSPRSGIEKLLQGKLKKYCLKDIKQKQKLILNLQRKGFCLEDIFSVLKNLQ
jgi:SOS response regulatory protein OraA/RecX